MITTREFTNAELAGLLEDFRKRYDADWLQYTDHGLIAECIKRLRAAALTREQEAQIAACNFCLDQARQARAERDEAIAQLTAAREQEAQPRMGTDWEGLPMPLPQSSGRADGKHWLDGFAGANVAVAPEAVQPMDWQRDPLDLVKTIALALERGYAPSDILDENSPIRDRIRLITEEQA